MAPNPLARFLSTYLDLAFGRCVNRYDRRIGFHRRRYCGDCSGETIANQQVWLTNTTSEGQESANFFPSPCEVLFQLELIEE